MLQVLAAFVALVVPPAPPFGVLVDAAVPVELSSPQAAARSTSASPHATAARVAYRFIVDSP
jgi:hypothetical protein